MTEARQRFSTRHTYRIIVIYNKINSLQLRPDPARKPSANLYGIYHCRVYSEKLLMMDRGSQKHVEFCSENKFEKLVHLFCFIIRIYHVTRSPEHQIRK